MALILFLGLSLFLQGALGELVCEDLPIGLCSFSVASSGKRCLLETYASIEDGAVEFECKTSEVVVKNMAELIERDECVSACGVDRKAVGISSDLLLDRRFTVKLCSPACYQNCPNILDLYHNLALGEGMYLPNLCKAQRKMLRRAMSQLSSFDAAPGPTSTVAVDFASDASGPVSSEIFAFDASAPAFM